MSDKYGAIPIGLIMDLAHDSAADGDEETASVLLALVVTWLTIAEGAEGSGVVS